MIVTKVRKMEITVTKLKETTLLTQHVNVSFEPDVALVTVLY